MKSGLLKQVLLITDGCSNKGDDPVAIASLLKEYGISVNVIGVLDEGQQNERELKEIEDIALCGGGVHQLVYAKNLSQTVQMVTRKSMTQTIQGLINKELVHILGKEETIESLPPTTRGEVLEVVDDLSEKADLQLIILVDTSASMAKKLDTVREALFDLHLSLHARMGKNEFSLFVFPGKSQDVEEILGWTPDLQSLSSTFRKLSSGGITPTGPALQAAFTAFEEKQRVRKDTRHERYMEERSS